MCVTDRNDMTIAIKVALNPNTINQSKVSHQTQYRIFMDPCTQFLLTTDENIRYQCPWTRVRSFTQKKNDPSQPALSAQAERGLIFFLAHAVNLLI